MWSGQNENYKRSTQKFPCHYCDKVFTRQGGLVGHLRVHTGERPHQCQMCGRRFSDSSSLTKHIRTHTGEKPFLCNFCNRAFSISHNLTRHLKLHSKEHQNVGSKVQISDPEVNRSSKAKKSYVCSKCGVVCQSFPDLNRHLQNIHTKCQSKPNTMISTKQGLENPNSLANSSKTVISDLSPVSSLAKNKQTADVKDFESSIHKEVCFQKELKMIIDLSEEDSSSLPSEEKNLFLLMPNNKNQDSFDHSISDSIDMDQNGSAASGKNTYNQRQSLLLEEIPNSTKTESLGTIPVNVSLCSNSASFFNTSDRLLHTETFSIEENKETSRVQNHFKSVHANKKTARTLRTGNNCKTKSHNKRMQSLPFQYRHEGNKGALKKGKINHHTKTLLRENIQKTVYLNTEKQKRKSELLSETKTALNTSIQKQTLHLHSINQQKLFGPNLEGPDKPQILIPRILQNLPEDITNEPSQTGEKKYPCLYCGKVFTRPGGLVGHTRVHTGEKPYKCQTCGKRFSDSSSLTKHIRTHTGEKPFQCKFCYRAFSISHNLTRHLKLHSRDKLHTRESKHFNQTSPGKASLQIRNNSRLLERRINKFNSSSNSKLRKLCPGPTSSEISTTIEFSLVPTVGPADDHQLLREKSFQTVTNDLTQFNHNDTEKYPTLVSDRLFSKEMVMPENDIKPILTNVSSLQMKKEISNTDQECVLTWCPERENNYFSNIKENLEQTISVPSLANSEYDPKKNFQERKEPNEILKNGFSVNSLDDAISANLNYNQSSSVVSKNISNNFELQPKVEPSWSESVINEGIESERTSLLSNNQQLDSAAIVAVDDCNYTNIECLLKTESVKLPLLESNEQQTAVDETSKLSHIYRCGYCPQQFQGIHLLSQHIQVHNKKSEHKVERKETENKTGLSETEFSESFREKDILKKKINLTFEDKSIERSEGIKLTLNSQPENMCIVNIETQLTGITKPPSDLTSSNLSLSSMKPSKNPIQNHNLHSLKNSQTKIPPTKTLLNGTKSKFRCTYCNKVFNRHGGLIGHLRVHTGEKPYECQTCTKRFSDSSSLTKHIRTHTGEKPFTCTICYRSFSISHNLTRHLKLHAREKQQNLNKSKSGNLFRSAEKASSSVRCRYCWATFQSLRVLKSHLRYHSFTSQTLKAGRRNAVRNGKRIINDAKNPVIEKTKTLNDENNEIPIIRFDKDIISANLSNKKKQFSSVNRIQNKILKTRNYHFGMTDSGSLGRKYINRRINFKTFPKTTLTSIGTTLESSEEMKNNEVVPGSLSATKEYSDVATLSWDNTSVPQTELFPKFTEQLKQSSAAFSKDDTGRKSTEIKPINEDSESRILLKSCQMNNEVDLTTNCESRISNQSFKKMLMEKTPFSSVCRHNETDINENVSKQLYSNYSSNHGKEIENIPKYEASGSKCGYCHKSFRDFSFLSRHMSVHKEQQSRQVKRYSSNRVNLLHSWLSPNKRLKMLRFGSERTKPWISLNKKDSRMYPCPFCPKQFTRHGGLVGHLRVHTGEKPHECQTCQKRFSDSSSLTKHIRTHTGEKPFHCKLCHRAFSISHNLTRHLKLHSREGLKVSTQVQQMKRKSKKCNEEVNVNQQLEENKIPSFDACSSSDVSHSSSVNLQADYCKTTPDPLENQLQLCHNKNTVSDHQILKISNPVSSSSSSNANLVSSSKSNEHQQCSHLEKISSHMRLSFEPVLGMTTDHLLSNVPDLGLSLSNHNVSSTQLLDDQEISLEYKPEFLSSSNQEYNVQNKNRLFSDASSSDVVSQILQPVTINHLPSISQETLGFSSDAAHLVSCNTKAVESLNKQNSQISSNKNESENQTNPFSDTFSKTFLLLKSLSDYNPAEINDLQPKHYSQNLPTENLQPNQIPNSYTENPNPRILTSTSSSFPNESNKDKTISESFLSPIKSLRNSCGKEDDCISVETVLSKVTEPLFMKQNSALSVDNKLFKPLHTFQNSQTSSNNGKNHVQINNQQTFTDNTSLSIPCQKTPIHKNTCILCRTYFPNHQQLQDHLKIHRTQNKTFTCGYCDRKFARFSGLMGHARVHTLERPYTCRICQRAFSDSSSLTKHTRIHTGEKPFTCKYCSRTFSISHNLTRHLKLHLREKNKLL